MYNEIVEFIRSMYGQKEDIPLHAPVFNGNEKKYLMDCIDSTYVSSVGKFVTQFEQMVADFIGSKYAVSAVNGTAALHIALLLADVQAGDEVVTQPLTFIATTNAISYCQAKPVFVDVDKDTMGLSPEALKKYLSENTNVEKGICRSRITGRRIKACVPMHTFGHPCRIDKIKEICDDHGITLVEDAAESLGSFFQDKHTGTFGLMGVLSFNGNKTITTGGGGMIITNDPSLAKRAKHITTTARVPHHWEFVHDEIGYNYRLINIAAALGCAQMEQLPSFLDFKQKLAKKYKDFFRSTQITFVEQPQNAVSNYWLNAVVFNNKNERDDFLNYTNERGIMTRPVWKLMTELKMYEDCQHGDIPNATWLEERVVNIPSSVKL